MKLQVDRSGSFTAVHINGELGSGTSDDFLEQVHESVSGSDAKVAVDLSGVESIDSTGLSALIQVVTRARLSKGQVVLVAPTPLVRGVFEVARLDTWFDICDSIEQAGQHFA